MRVLIVEDEAIVAIMAEMFIESLGHSVIGPASCVESALKLIENNQVDAALLDVNLTGEYVYPVANKLIELAIPFVFTTGYAVDGLNDSYHNIEVIAKPYTEGSIGRALAAILEKND
jgi:two-component SAPR family response regulator